MFNYYFGREKEKFDEEKSLKLLLRFQGFYTFS